MQRSPRTPLLSCGCCCRRRTTAPTENTSVQGALSPAQLCHQRRSTQTQHLKLPWKLCSARFAYLCQVCVAFTSEWELHERFKGERNTPRFYLQLIFQNLKDSLFVWLWNIWSENQIILSLKSWLVTHSLEKYMYIFLSGNKINARYLNR